MRLPTSDEKIRERTGLGWEEWFDLLDEWGAPERPHREIARWVAGRLDLHPLAWNVQAVTSGYELTRGLRVPGQGVNGFTATATRTVAVPVDRLYDAFVDEPLRATWLSDGDLRERTATKPKSARFDWGDDGSRVVVDFAAKDDAKSTAALRHERLADAREVERMKAYWRERVTTLKEVLER